MPDDPIRILFLDIDGVLRRREAPLYKLEPDLRARFERVVHALPGVRIVITSSWREEFSLDEIRGHFAASIAKRIVGITPSARLRDDFARYREVRAYLKRHHGADARWVAVDDDPENYPPGAPVVIVDPDVGLDDAAAAEMLWRLS